MKLLYALALTLFLTTTSTYAQDATKLPTINEINKDSEKGNVVREWKIFFKNGSVIEFDAAWNVPDERSGPSRLLLDHLAFLLNGTTPTYPRRYVFPKNTDADPTGSMAHFTIDIKEVGAIVYIIK